MGALFALPDCLKLGIMPGQVIVQFGNQPLDGGDKLNQTFGDEYRAEIVAGFGALGYDGGNVGYNIVQRQVLCFHLFGNDADVRLCLKGTFKGDVGSGASHELDEVPVFAGRVAVAFNVADDFGIYLAGSVETERGFNLFVLQIAVDGFRATDDLYARTNRLVVFSQHTGVCVGIISSDDNQCLDVKLLQYFKPFVELLCGFQLCPPRTDHVETARVAVFVNNVGSQFPVCMFNQTGGTQDKAVQAGSPVDSLDAVEQAGYHVMPARSLSAGEDYAYIHSRHRLGVVVLFKGNQGHPVGIGKQFLNISLIGYRLGVLAVGCLYGTLQCNGDFRSISRPCNL
ncbi:hypothetical protein Barb7_01270 [Bacteroidales bacterium Barb7]|nr:hypothetical protein Barb7_01270 [Bacteroidales bacterium Barb7]